MSGADAAASTGYGDDEDEPFSVWFRRLCRTYRIDPLVAAGAASMMASLPAEHYQGENRYLSPVVCIRLACKWCYDDLDQRTWDRLDRLATEVRATHRIDWIASECRVLAALRYHLDRHFPHVPEETPPPPLPSLPAPSPPAPDRPRTRRSAKRPADHVDDTHVVAREPFYVDVAARAATRATDTTTATVTAVATSRPSRVVPPPPRQVRTAYDPPLALPQSQSQSQLPPLPMAMARLVPPAPRESLIPSTTPTTTPPSVQQLCRDVRRLTRRA